MPARVIVIGLDAAEATLVERLKAEGRLPTFARLAAEGSVARLGNSLESLPGGIWPELTTGRSCGKLGQYYHPRQLHTGEARLRKIEADEVNASEYYWSIASRQGRRVAVVDQPQAVLSPDLNGVHVLEWGLHDRNFGIEAHPPGLLEELRARYGDHPVDSCDRIHGRTHGGYERLAEAIPAVYERVDEAVGKLLEAAGESATALVVLSHGMGNEVGGYQLLPELLVR